MPRSRPAGPKQAFSKSITTIEEEEEGEEEGEEEVKLISCYHYPQDNYSINNNR